MSAAAYERKRAPAVPGWKTVRLGEVAERCLGKMLDAGKNKGRLLPYLANPNVRWFGLSLLALKEMPFEDHELERYGLREGDVLICEGGEAGRACIWDGRLPNVKFQKAIHRVRCGPELFNRYLVHRLMADYFSGTLADYYTGATIKHLTGQDLARYEFPLPALPEQRRIAAILDQAESLRAKRRLVLDRLDGLALSLFIDFFGDLRNPTEHQPLAGVAEVVSGVTKGRRFNGQKPVQVPYLRVANVQAGFLDLTEIKTIEALPTEVEELRLHAGDIVLTEGGDFDKLGRGAMWQAQIESCIHQNHVFRVRVDSSALVPEFFHYFLQTEPARGYFLRCAKRTTNLASINITQLRGLDVPLPPISLQRAFAAQVAAVEKLKSSQRASLAKLDALFASLQHRAFRGEL